MTQKQTMIASLVALNVGRMIEGAVKGEDKPVMFKLTRLAEKMGTMKNGDKAEYVIFSRNDDENKVVSLHPNIVKELFDNGVASGYKLLAAQVGATAATHGAEAVEVEANVEPPSEEEQEHLNAELEAAQAGATDTNAGAAEGGTPSDTTTEGAGEDKTEGDATLAGAVGAATAPKKTKAEKDAEKKAAAKKREDDRAAARDKKEAEKKAAKEAKDKEAGPSKKDLALDIYLAEPDGENKRKNVIAKFKAAKKDGGLEMSAPGANTYYQNCKSGFWKKDDKK